MQVSVHGHTSYTFFLLSKLSVRFLKSLTLFNIVIIVLIFAGNLLRNGDPKGFESLAKMYTILYASFKSPDKLKK